MFTPTLCCECAQPGLIDAIWEWSIALIIIDRLLTFPIFSSATTCSSSEVFTFGMKASTIAKRESNVLWNWSKQIINCYLCNRLYNNNNNGKAQSGVRSDWAGPGRAVGFAGRGILRAKSWNKVYSMRRYPFMNNNGCQIYLSYCQIFLYE